MNGLLLGMLDGATLVNWLASDVHDTAERSWSNGNHDGGPCISGRPPSYKAFGTWAFTSVKVCHRTISRKLTVHSNSSDHIFTKMLLLQSKPKSRIPHSVR